MASTRVKIAKNYTSGHCMSSWMVLNETQNRRYISSLIYFNIDYTLIQKSCKYAEFLMSAFMWTLTYNAYGNENYENSLSHVE